MAQRKDKNSGEFILVYIYNDMENLEYLMQKFHPEMWS